MGMRATIAVIDADKQMKMTSVQWSTKLDANIGVMAYTMRENTLGTNEVKRGKMLNDVYEVFKAITDTYTHISAFETDESGSEEVIGGQFHEGLDANRVQRGKVHELKKRAYSWHLDSGSVGLLINAGDYWESGKIELFYEDQATGDLKVSKVSVDALANFYKDGSRKKLKKFGFRSV